MYISSIALQQFRSHHDFTVSFDDRVTMIVGANGSGKTNILEAIYVLCRGKSFRDSDEYLAEYDQEWWKIIGTVDEMPREVRYLRGEKSFHHDDKQLKRLSTTAQLPVVLFEPDDLMLIHGSPSGRRKYIDSLISRITPGYATTVRRYERILAQRNALLRSPQGVDTDKLFVWDILLAEQAEMIVTHRLDIVSRWNERLREYYSRITDEATDISAAYISKVSTLNYKQSLLQHLKHNLPRDSIVGSTSVGPHRDDIECMIDGKSFVTSASRGEIRSLLLSLKYDEVVQMEHFHHTPPLVLLDDVFSELDAARQQQLVDKLFIYQTIITATDFPHHATYRMVNL